ncbi:MAG: sigma-70 family RNA polymerase sigma factor [Gemmataceae bacterium]|nr:sigma-70 family RNA polymerase sigma factor [Gemmataceae bacterium]MDW8267094.1 sigma-70 family RNA polymerase sigma factor [Gemmataceae bacterium]
MASPTPPDAGLSSEQVEAFVRLLGQHQRRIFLYVLSLVPRWDDAEEIVQETNLVLWREFGRFQPGTNFAAWACKIAFHQVLAWRKRRQRDRLELSPEFLESVAEEAIARGDELDDRAQALAGCIAKLPPDHRTLLRLRYSDGLSVEAIAQQLQRTVDAVYRALSRIRRALHACVTQSLQRQARP